METIELLKNFSKEINKEWSSEYNSIIQDGELRLKHNDVVIAIIDEDLDLSMLEEDKDAEEQLIYMLQR